MFNWYGLKIGTKERTVLKSNRTHRIIVYILKSKLSLYTLIINNEVNILHIISVSLYLWELYYFRKSTKSRNRDPYKGRQSSHIICRHHE